MYTSIGGIFYLLYFFLDLQKEKTQGTFLNIFFGIDYSKWGFSPYHADNLYLLFQVYRSTNPVESHYIGFYPKQTKPL